VAESDDEDKHLFVANRVDDAIIAGSDAEQVWAADKSLDAIGTGFDGELVNEGGDAVAGISGELAKLAACGGTKFDSVGRIG
jgi:hypothetical protein